MVQLPGHGLGETAHLGQQVLVQQVIGDDVAGDASYPAALAYSEKKYQLFHSGISTCRTPSRMPCSVTIRLPPRRIGDDIRNQRIASAPSRSNTSRTSG